MFHFTYIQTKCVQGALKYIQGLKVKKRHLEWEVMRLSLC